MYICVCRAISDTEVKAAIDRGADSVGAVAEVCCAGNDCTACHDAIEALIERRWGCVAMEGGCRWSVPSEKR